MDDRDKVKILSDMWPNGAVVSQGIPQSFSRSTCAVGSFEHSGSDITESTNGDVFFVALSAPYLIFMFVGVVFNYLHRGKITLSAAVIAAPVILLMYWMAHQLGSSLVKPFVFSYVIAVFLFALAMRFSVIFRSIPTIGFWADISYPMYVIHGLTGYVSLGVMITFGFGAWPAIVLTYASEQDRLVKRS